MDSKTFCQSLIDRLLQRGADKVVVSLNESETNEYNLVYKELNLLRSIESKSLNIQVLKDQKRVTESVNQLDDDSVSSAIDSLMNALEHSKGDPAFDIAAYQEPGEFKDGALEPDKELIVSRLKEFALEMKTDFPSVYFDASLSHTHSESRFMNSNGVDYTQQRGYYEFSSMFTAKKDGKMSSMNYFYYQTTGLDKALLDVNQNRSLVHQIEGQTHPGSIPAKFKGDVILAPMVTASLLGSLIQDHFGDGALIGKMSMFPDHLGQKLFSEKLTVKNMPRDPRMALKYYLTIDGYLSQSAAVIEKGVLKHYPIGIYAANKTGKELTNVTVNNLVIEGGERSLDEIIKDTKEGILCMRASYGSPGPQGDMSTVAKNSYYIKDGRLVCPVSETMISFNLIEAFRNIDCFSSDTHVMGSYVIPYMKFSGATISKKD